MSTTTEDLLYRVELDFEIDDTYVSCEDGDLEYTIEGECGIVNAISVYYRTREGIGTQLVNQFESLAIAKGVKSVDVPVSPTQEAIFFWYSLGYEPATKEDKKWANKISRAVREREWDIPSGVVVMSKKL